MRAFSYRSIFLARALGRGLQVGDPRGVRASGAWVARQKQVRIVRAQVNGQSRGAHAVDKFNPAAVLVATVSNAARCGARRGSASYARKASNSLDFTRAVLYKCCIQCSRF